MANSGFAYDMWDVKKAAGQLQGHAFSISTHHLSFPAMEFKKEVANYAKHIIKQVELGHETPEQGMQAIQEEARSLQNQSFGLMRDGHTPINDMFACGPWLRLRRPIMGPDPERLLRYARDEQRKAANEKTQTAQVVSKAPDRRSDHGRNDFLPPRQRPMEIELHGPGFYIVPKSTTAEQLEAQLFISPKPAVIAKFRALNPGLDQVKAGQLIVLSDPDNPQCTREEAKLMATADRVNRVLADLSPEEADFMTRHRDEIESFLTHGSTAVGVGTAVFAKNLDEVKLLLKKIEALHTSTFEQHGHLRSPEFFAKRKELFAQLDTQLTSLTKKSIGFPDHPKLKTALGISGRSLVHRAGRAGGFGQNPGYATRLARVAKVSKYVQYGGWVGTAVGGGASYMKVQDVCGAGDAEACEKVKYTEGGGFAGGIAGGVAAGAALGAVGTGAICAAIGPPTFMVGTLMCGLVVVVGVGGVSFAAGALGGKGGEAIGEVIYEVTK